MHMPFNSQMEAKDRIAHELLDLDEDDAAATIDEAHEHALGPAVDLASRVSDPAFLNEDRETEIDILTGDAE